MRTIFELAFIGRNIFTGVHQNADSGLGTNVVYRFLSAPHHNWRKLIGLLSQMVIKGFLEPLTHAMREKVLILDTTLYHRSRSRRVELLWRVYDHCSQTYRKGFRMLTLGWSDGASFVPVDHAVLSSPKDKHRIQGITKGVDRRTCGARRRQEALRKSTELIVPMVKRALGLLISAKYLLMDSWFGFPAVVRSLMEHIHVICTVKNTSRIFYEFEGRSLTLTKIYRSIRKGRGRAKIKGSVIVGIGEDKKAKLVFVRRRNRNHGAEWLALLCTDLSLADDEVVRIYGKRWDIEVFFKMAKHYLKLDSEIQVRDFDSILAHSTIVMIRYICLAVEQRIASDTRSVPRFSVFVDGVPYPISLELGWMQPFSPGPGLERPGYS
ncbi:transposase, partial [Thermodesulfobacteriota bacterium]